MITSALRVPCAETDDAAVTSARATAVPGHRRHNPLLPAFRSMWGLRSPRIANSTWARPSTLHLRFPQLIGSSRSDRLYQARIIVLDVADARAPASNAPSHGRRCQRVIKHGPQL